MNAEMVQGGMFTVMVVRVDDPNDPSFESRLAEQVARSPAFFANAPVVIDIKNAAGCATADAFQAIRKLFRRQHLILVGIVNGNATQIRAAMNADLAAFPPNAARREEARASASASASSQRSEATWSPLQAGPISTGQVSAGQVSAGQVSTGPGSRTKIVTQPVRSGTQIYARGGDLVVLNAVSPGAEVIADGNVHIYGALRGRAIAGASGDTEARIFAEKLHAELVCVAGQYLVSEAIPKAMIGQAVQVTLESSGIALSPLTAIGREK